MRGRIYMRMRGLQYDTSVRLVKRYSPLLKINDAGIHLEHWDKERQNQK